MKRVVSVFFLLIGMSTLLAGCGSNKDKTALLDWLQSINKDNTDMYFLDLNDMDDDEPLLAMTLSEDEIQTLTDIFAEMSVKDIIPDEEPFKPPSMRYGLMLNDKAKYYGNYVNKRLLQLVSPDGEIKIYYQEKDWLIKNKELGDFLLSLSENE